jgi:hypothetical protein
VPSDNQLVSEVQTDGSRDIERTKALTDVLEDRAAERRLAGGTSSTVR